MDNQQSSTYKKIEDLEQNIMENEMNFDNYFQSCKNMIRAIRKENDHNFLLMRNESRETKQNEVIKTKCLQENIK